MISLDMIDLNRGPRPVSPRRAPIESAPPRPIENPVQQNPFPNPANGISNLLRSVRKGWGEIGLPAQQSPFFYGD